jgi:Fic family protein
LREIYDLQNTEKVFNELNMNETLGNNFIQKIHSGLMEKIDSRTGYRRENVQVRHSRFDSTPWHLITTDMNLLMKWFKENEKKLHPFVLAVIFHHKFEKIHPFMDGNGRTGRMLLNFILMKKGYPPMIIRRRRRDEYLDALSKADLAGLGEAGPEYRRLAKFCAEEMQDGYWGAFL